MKKLKNIKGLLSREEMRQIQGGSGGAGCRSCTPGSGQCYCAHFSGDCQYLQCGCGYWCL